MMFHVMRSWYKYGREGDEVMITDKYYDTIEKALAYAQRYAKGIRFVMVQIETDDDNMELIYEYLADGGKCTVDKTAKYKITAESQEKPTEQNKALTMTYEFYFDGISITCNECERTETYLHLRSNGSFVAMIDLSLYSVVFYDKVNDYIVFRLKKIEQHDKQQELEQSMEYEDYLREVDEINSDGLHVAINRDDIVSNEELQKMIAERKEKATEQRSEEDKQENIYKAMDKAIDEVMKEKI